MAKRKSKSRGGGFGAPKSLAHHTAPEIKFIERVSRTEPTLKVIQKILSHITFESEQEMGEFVEKKLLGKSLEELHEMMFQLAPPGDEDEAEKLLDELPEDSSPEEAVQTAKQAIEICPNCLAAWLMLSFHEPDETKALEYTEQGINHGITRFQDKIDAIDNIYGLWSDIDARDLLRLMANKGRIIELMPGGLMVAEEAYRQCLKWCPNDNLGVRNDLLRLLMVQRRLDDAQALIDAFPNDRTTAMSWGRALVSICLAIERTGYEPPAEDLTARYSTPREYLNSLDPEFSQSKKLVRLAMRVNPFVAVFITEGGLLEVKTPDVVVTDGPYEAIEYLQKWSIFWQVAGLPMVMLTDAAPRNLDRHVKGKAMAEEIIDIAEQLDEYDGPGWWSILEESTFDEEDIDPR